MDAAGGQQSGDRGEEAIPPAQALQRLSELVRRVNSSTDTADVLEEIVRGVREVLGYGVAAIARFDGDMLVMSNVAGPEEARRQILGRRTPARFILDEFRQADRWGILRYVPHGRMSQDRLAAAWLPDLVPGDEPDAWHPEDALYAPLYSATGELLGNMAVDLPPGNRIPNQQERDLLEMFVVQAGLALSNAQQRERLAEQVRFAATVTEVAQAGNRIGLSAVLEAAGEAIARGLGTLQIWIRCYPEAGQDGSVAAGAPAGITGSGVPSLRVDLQESVWPSHTPVRLHVTDPDSELLPRSRAELQAKLSSVGAFEAVVAPFGVGLEMLGYLVLAFPGGHEGVRPVEMDAISEIARELGQLVQSARLLETEQRLVSELRELDRYKGELIATISHELKTPLTSIIGHIELLGEHEETNNRSVQAIARNAERLDRLVQNLLDYSRVQARMAVVRDDVDLEALCASALDLLAMQAETGGVRVRLERPAGSVVVSGDPEELSLVVHNLVGNAVKYTRRDGEVVVRLSADDQVATVSVADTGIGISPVDQTHLFSAFHRSSNPEALSIPGSGLGLAISRRIVETHGGRIEVASQLARGSTFTVLLPRRARTLAED